MTKFAVGRAQTTRESAIVVDAGLSVGLHRFQLVVVNAAGKKSSPDQVLMRVQAMPLAPDIRPNPVSPITLIGPRKSRRKRNMS